MRRRNLVTAALLLAVGIAYAGLAANLPTRNIENATGPSFFPLVAVTCFIGLSLILLVQGLFALVSDKVPELPKISISRYGAGLGIAVAYLGALPYAGFIAADIALFAALMVLYGEKRPLWVAGFSVAIPLFVFILFREVFQIQLPAGILDGFV
ncbi:MAG: tripartite tricarboxylate transporter TctB family protein [Rhodospirillales bacterium]|nr:tripartite tricarboxylate transporter TctB family protein [Rhodospirillales bacterium]